MDATLVHTATGAVASDQLGVTLPHEHVFVNLMAERRGDGLLNDEELMIAELQKYRAQGGVTLWDLTTAELTDGSTLTATGRPLVTRTPDNVTALARVSERTGVLMVLGAGHYRDPYIDRDTVDRLTVAAMTEHIVRDIEHGFPDTQVRAGIIGEIGSDKWYVSALEERSFRASARAGIATGVPVYTHAARWPVGHAQLDILREEGLDPARVVIGHTDTVPDDDYSLSLIQRGANVGFDTINSSNPFQLEATVRRIVNVARAGYLDRVLISHDVCLVSQLTTYGGNGYTLVLGSLRDQLAKSGITDDEFHHITVVNPRRILTGQ